MLIALSSVYQTFNILGGKMRVVFIIDDLRHEDLCYDLNKVKREKDDVIILAKDARSAAITLLQLAENGIPIDIIMLDHDLGDGLDVTWFLNWLLGNIDSVDIVYMEEPLRWVGLSISNSEWKIHTSNYGVVQSMKDKITQIQKWLDMNM